MLGKIDKSFNAITSSRGEGLEMPKLQKVGSNKKYQKLDPRLNKGKAGRNPLPLDRRLSMIGQKSIKKSNLRFKRMKSKKNKFKIKSFE